MGRGGGLEEREEVDRGGRAMLVILVHNLILLSI